MDDNHSDICVIGAGMAGLACATALQRAGRRVRVLDKGRGPGGRMAARRVEIAGETVSFDHGAQYFTARDTAFREAVLQWEQEGFVARWEAASKSAEDPAWVGIPGMNCPIRAMAQDLPVEWAVRAESLSREADMWRIETADRSFTANTVLVAVPAEQAHDLLSDPAATLAHIAGSVVSAPCWAVMVAFADRLAIANDAMRDPAAPISWAARNSAKPGRAGEECWVLHASPERSRELIDLPKEEVGPHLLADFFAQMSTMPVEPIHLAAHRWLYAMPASQKGEPALYETSQGIGIAGDYLHSPRVEGAWLSGNALAQRVLSAK